MSSTAGGRRSGGKGGHKGLAERRRRGRVEQDGSVGDGESNKDAQGTHMPGDEAGERG